MTKFSVLTRGRLPLLLAAILAVVAFAGARPAAAQTTNRLVNPGFEDPFSSGVANSWAKWHEDQGKKGCGTSLVQPTWFAERNSALILGGAASQGVGNQFDTWRGGVFQTVSGLTVGATYRFTFSGRMFASNSNFGTAPSDGTGIMRAGIDPNGSGLWNDGDVVWSGAIAPHGSFQSVSVETVATADKVTVFAEARYNNSTNYCAAHLDAWFENAELVQVSATGGTPAPAPGNTPAPPPAPVVIATAGPTPTPDAEGVIYYQVPPGGSLWGVAALAGITLDELLELNDLTRDSFVQAGQLLIVGYAEPSATETPEAEAEASETPTEPEATPEPTATLPPTAPPGGVICVNVFGDLDGNGQREASEGYMAGVTFTVSDDVDIVGQGVSRGTDQAICFENVPSGTYQVAQVLPSSLEPTTASDVSIDLATGQQIRLEFGSRVRTATPTEEVASVATPAPAATGAPATDAGGGLGLTAISGLILIVVAILLLGGILLLVTRQRR